MIVYRKHGTVARWENGTLIRVTEAGIAIEDGDYFECRPLECGGNASAFESGGVAAALQNLRDLTFERLIITHGVADHECEGKTWREETDRIHASLVHDKLRALVDSTLGAPAAGRPVHRPLAGAGEPPANQPAGSRRSTLDALFLIANALQRAEHTERAIEHVILAPNVTAALLPQLATRHPQPNIRIIQTATGVDAYGNDIIETDRDWPNAYRPSYRVRPIRMPLNLRIECESTQIDEDLPRAIALLAPVTSLTIRVLVEDADRVYPATVAVADIRAVSNERIWYPYGGGSFGAALML